MTAQDDGPEYLTRREEAKALALAAAFLVVSGAVEVAEHWATRKVRRKVARSMRRYR